MHVAVESVTKNWIFGGKNGKENGKKTQKSLN
jgi:hypothetical protein